MCKSDFQSGSNLSDQKHRYQLLFCTVLNYKKKINTLNLNKLNY